MTVIIAQDIGTGIWKRHYTYKGIDCVIVHSF